MAVRFFGSKATPPRDDSLQISGAIVAPSDGPSPVQLVDAGHAQWRAGARPHSRCPGSGKSKVLPGCRSGVSGGSVP